MPLLGLYSDHFKDLKYSQLLKWIAKAKPKGPFTLQIVYRCQLSEEAAQDAGVTVGEEFRGGV